MAKRFLVLLALGAFAAVESPALAQSRWKAGAAKIDITPRESIWMAGYGMRTKPSEGVRQEIYAKALVLEDETGTRTVLVTSDLLGFPREVSDPIAAQVQQKYGIPRARLALNSSHTHSGPVIGRMLHPAYPLTPDQEPVIQRYTERLIGQVVEVIGSAIANLQPAQVAFGQGVAGFAVNRRRVTLRRNLPGPVDQDVPVLSVRGADGSLRAVAFGYACHNTVLADYEINGDYAGFAQEALEQAHPGAIALFVEDCGADANPLPRRSVDLARKYGQILAAAVDEVLRGKMRPQSGPVRAAFALVDVPFQKPPSRAEFESRLHGHDASVARHAKYMLSILDRDGKLPDRYPYPVQVWRFGGGLSWIILGGEVVVDYSLRFKKQYGWDDLWVAGYSNDVFAYIPSERVLEEGGYEGGGAMIPYGQPAPFAAGVEGIIAGKVDDLMRRTGGAH
ncbi:MAG TPA: neutral/alkaline non-lysosomal ceramidase N-terminal domain-containing protein [Bryobacteraceae bacterium]|nr:neutral/alkaline non-lysosomal ceramidase N-terminal domain-containing protein [Bryobacteraceae bacterium]